MNLGTNIVFFLSITGFMGLQTAKSYGYIDVDWNKIKGDAIAPLDLVRMIEYIVMLADFFCVVRFSSMKFLVLTHVVLYRCVSIYHTIYFTHFGRLRRKNEYHPKFNKY